MQRLSWLIFTCALAILFSDQVRAQPSYQDYPCILIGDKHHCPPSGPPINSFVSETTPAEPQHHCALTDGKVYCHGNNQYGQVGIGADTDPVLTPTLVADLPAPAKQLAVGRSHTCAIAGQSLYCWGRNTYGQVGVTGHGFYPSPVRVSLPQSPPTRVVAGDDFTCAIASGGLYCWGSNLSGALGVQDVPFRADPRIIPALSSGVSEVAAAGGGACALKNGRLMCWGTFGAPDRITHTPVLVKVPLRSISAIATQPHGATVFDGRCFVGIPSYAPPGSPWYRRQKTSQSNFVHLGCAQ